MDHENVGTHAWHTKKRRKEKKLGEEKEMQKNRRKGKKTRKRSYHGIVMNLKRQKVKQSRKSKIRPLNWQSVANGQGA